jgi:hypothetical protein
MVFNGCGVDTPATTATMYFPAQTFLTACVNGNFVGVNVINSTTGTFNENLTYPAK